MNALSFKITTAIAGKESLIWVDHLWYYFLFVNHRLSLQHNNDNQSLDKNGQFYYIYNSALNSATFV